MPNVPLLVLAALALLGLSAGSRALADPELKSWLGSAFTVSGEESELWLSVLSDTRPDAQPVPPRTENVTIRFLTDEVYPRTTRERLYVYKFSIRSYTEGAHTIPPFDLVLQGQTLRSQPLALHVGTLPESAWSTHQIGGADVRYAAHVFTPQRIPFEGETVPTEAKLYLPDRLLVSDSSIAELEHDGIVAWRFEASKVPYARRVFQTSVRLGGENYVGVAYHSTATPIRTGGVSLGPGHALNLTSGLRQEYAELFTRCSVRPERAAEIDAAVDRMVRGRDRYEAVTARTGVPWYVIAVIHCMETGLRFDRHLHNGDPLTRRTTHVPAGRPKDGDPPFEWEESAVDALRLRRLGPDTDWSLPGMLYEIEGFNGWGYRLYHAHVLSPYLWSFSNHYHSGKYVADGTWSDTANSKQCGAAVMLRRMAERNLIAFEDQPSPDEDDDILLVSWSKKEPRDPLIVARAEDLQEWLNTFPGIFVKVDGHPGNRTSDAFRKVTGMYLPDDPRA